MIELPDAQLKAQFCKAPAPRFYATFRGSVVTDDTAAAELACKS
ncbi:hypothetical protein [Caenimonas koreensis]|nr:hypothetical protein [Caenimonas koreensis]